MNSNKKVVLALVVVLMTSAIAAYFALDGRVSPVALVLSLVTGDDQSESDAFKSSKELDSAVASGNMRRAEQAMVTFLEFSSRCLANDPSSDKCSALLKTSSERYGTALLTAAKKFLSEDRIKELEAPKMAQTVSAPVASAQPTRPAAVLVPGGAGMVASVTDDCYRQLVTGPNTISRDCKAQLETVLTRTGGEVVIPPMPAMPATTSEPLPLVEQSDVRQAAELPALNVCADLPSVGSRTRTEEVGKLNALKAKGLLRSEQAERLQCFARSYRERTRMASAVTARHAKAR